MRDDDGDFAYLAKNPEAVHAEEEVETVDVWEVRRVAREQAQEGVRLSSFLSNLILNILQRTASFGGSNGSA